MSQVVHGKFAQLVKVSEEEMIPAAIIDAQTRDDKDELIMGAGNMVFDPSIGDNGLWVPVSKDNPLEARVRHLEALIGKLDDAKETNPDAASAALLPLLRGLLATLATESTLGDVKSALTSLVGAAATESTLDDVKTAAETLAGTVADGAQKVTLTGHVALLNALSSSASAWRGWGTTVGIYAGTHPNPLDVSDYPRRLIHVRNDTNVEVTGVRLNVYGVAGEASLASEGFPNIPAGATLVIDGTNSEIIDKPYPYISLRTLASNATEGAQYVTFFGGV